MHCACKCICIICICVCTVYFWRIEESFWEWMTGMIMEKLFGFGHLLVFSDNVSHYCVFGSLQKRIKLGKIRKGWMLEKSSVPGQKAAEILPCRGSPVLVSVTLPYLVFNVKKEEGQESTGLWKVKLQEKKENLIAISTFFLQDIVGSTPM